MMPCFQSLFFYIISECAEQQTMLLYGCVTCQKLYKSLSTVTLVHSTVCIRFSWPHANDTVHDSSIYYSALTLSWKVVIVCNIVVYGIMYLDLSIIWHVEQKVQLRWSVWLYTRSADWESCDDICGFTPNWERMKRLDFGTPHVQEMGS